MTKIKLRYKLSLSVDIITTSIAILLTLTLLASCGGGGGGGGGTSAPAPITSHQLNFSVDVGWDATIIEANAYKTAEYNNQWGLDAINAANAYAILEKNGKTIAGSGVKISIVDSGALISHQEIAANYNSSGDYDYINNDPTPNDDRGHGTHVASTAAAVKNNVGIHGVAYESQIVAFKSLDSDGFGSTSTVADGINESAAVGAKVLNLSLGAGSPSSIIKSTLQTTKNADILSVAATGNDGNSQPDYPAYYAIDSDLQGSIIAVGSVDSDSNISSFSNHCGNTKNYCLVAPGENIHGAYIGGDTAYADYSGTSMATPHVAGAAAVLRAAWTHLNASQTAQILLQTATDLGEAGTDDIYGRGLLNLEYAVQAQGQNILNYGSSASSGGYDLSTSSLSTDPIFGDAFTNNIAPNIESAIFLDDYGRDYKAFLGKKISSRANINHFNLEPIFFNNFDSKIAPLNIGKKSIFRLQTPQYRNPQAKNELGLQFVTIDNSQEYLPNENQGFSFQQSEKIFGKSLDWGLAFNIDEVSNLQINDANLNNSLLAQSFGSSNPYQSFFRQNNNDLFDDEVRNFRQFYLGKDLLSNNLNLNLSYQSSYDSNHVLKRVNNKQNESINLGIAYKMGKNNKLSLSFGSLEEFDNNILNSKSLGVFESKNNTETSYIKLISNHKITKTSNLLLSYSEGLTKVGGNNQGIFRNYSNLRSRSTAVGVTFDEFFKGKLGFIYLQPLRIYSGKVQYSIPVSRDDDGNLYRKDGTSSLKPQGKQQDFEVFYLGKISNESTMKLNFLIQKEAGNIKNEPINYLAAVIFNKTF